MKGIKTIDSLYHACTYGRAPVVFERGRGARLWNDKGRDYIDFGSGIGVMSLGYANPAWGIFSDEVRKMVSAVLGRSSPSILEFTFGTEERTVPQAAVLPHTSNLFYNEKTAMLAGRLALRTHFERVFLSNSGAEANECLIKTARKWASDTKGEGEHPFVTLVNSFHGRTLPPVTATGQDTFHKFFGPFTPGFRYVPAGDLAALERQLDAEDCSAVLVEIVQGEGGVRALDADYLKAVEALCHEKNVLFCVDEVQTGNGRTGTWFAYEQFGLSPDLVSTAKGLGNGLPIGATLMGPKTAEVLTPGTHGSTFGGNPVACAGALSVLEQIDDAFLEAVKQKGAWLTAELEKIPGVKDVSGLGLMLGFSVEGCKSADIKAKALDNGLVVLTAKDRVRLLPPLAITEEELSDGLLRLAAAIREVQEAAH